MSDTSYAVSAKARAKYGRFLTDRDYTNLLACQSVPEVMVYLKSHTRYASVLEQVNERDVHRGKLEVLLRQHQFNELDALCRYDSSISAGFSRFIVEKTEVDQLIRFLILLNSDSTEKFIFQYPAFLSRHTELHINLLANARDYDEFLNALAHTSYYDVLKTFHPDAKGRLPISDIESKLYALIIRHMRELIDKKTKGTEHRELTDIFGKMVDYSIVSRIIRMKKYYHLPPEVIKADMPPEYGSISPKLIQRMCEAESVDEIFSILHGTSYGRFFEKSGRQGSEIVHYVQYKTAKHNIHFSRNPSVVMVSFMFLSETELMNVISMIEGIRYGLDPKIIESLLIR